MKDVGDNVTAAELSALLQDKWVQKGKQRFQIEGEPPAGEHLALLQEIGSIDECWPSVHGGGANRYDAILIMGALASRVNSRIEWHQRLVADGYVSAESPVYLLGGARQIDAKQKEGKPAPKETRETLSALLGCELSEEEMPKTEAEMMRLFATRMGLKATLVDTPMQPDGKGGLRPPNTTDTVRMWLKEFGGNGVRSCLVISNQPFATYQVLTVWRAILEATGHQNFVEGTGPEANVKLPLATFQDNLAKQLYEELKQQELMGAGKAV